MPRIDRLGIFCLNLAVFLILVPERVFGVGGEELHLDLKF